MNLTEISNSVIIMQSLVEKIMEARATRRNICKSTYYLLIAGPDEQEKDLAEQEQIIAASEDRLKLEIQILNKYV